MARKSAWPFLVSDHAKPIAEDDAVVQLSESGAVLGRPDREHGAYGMVQEKSGGEAPSREERVVRGLGQKPMPVDKQ